MKGLKMRKDKPKAKAVEMEVDENHIISSMSCTNHSAYIVEVKLREAGKVVNDKYGWPIFTAEDWKNWDLRKVKQPEMQSQYPMQDDMMIPKGCAVMTYASAMCVAWGIIAEDQDRIFLVRVMPCRIDMSWKATRGSENTVINIKTPN